MQNMMSPFECFVTCRQEKDKGKRVNFAKKSTRHIWLHFTSVELVIIIKRILAIKPICLEYRSGIIFVYV